MTLVADRPIAHLERDFYAEAARPGPHADRFDAAALAVTGLLIAALVSRVSVPARELLLLAYVCWVPGRAVTTHWRTIQGPALLIATSVGSIALTTLLATVILWLHFWGPTTLFSIEAGACTVSLLVGWSRRSGLRRPSTKPEQSLAPGRRGSSIPWRPRTSEIVVVLAALALWAWGLTGVQLGRIDQWGLLPALPLPFYAGFTLLAASIIWLLRREQPSGPGLVLHLAALVFVLMGTPALVYPAPRYPWLYKHVGVVQYINIHGAVNQSVDIYQNWPGFFALMAWFDRVAGIASPLRLAAWSETVVMLATCGALYVACRHLELTARERWIGLFVFVMASWVDETYFSPQALAYILSVSVIALILSMAQDPSGARWYRRVRQRLDPIIRRFAHLDRPAEQAAPVMPGSPTARVPLTTFGLVSILGIFTVLSFVHQLSPYVVALQVGVLAVFGRIRPRWLAVALWVIPLGYLLPRFNYVNRTQGLLKSFGDFTSNVQTNSLGVHRPYDLGVRYVAHAAVAISAIVWIVALVGTIRRLRAGRPTMVLAILAFSPITMFFMTSYGGEASYRVYFFSLPWAALLAASAFSPVRRGGRSSPMVALATMLILLAALILPAYYGNDDLYLIPSGEVVAAQYLYNHAPNGSALVLAAPNFPSRISGRYDEYQDLQNEAEPNLLYYKQLADYRVLGPQSLPVLSDLVRTFDDKGRRTVFVVFAASGYAAVKGFNLAPAGALQDLEVAMSHSRQWTIFYQNSTTTVLRFNPGVGGP